MHAEPCGPLAVASHGRIALTYNFRIGWQQQVGVNEINTGTAGCNRATLRGVARLGSGGLKGSPVWIGVTLRWAFTTLEVIQRLHY